MAFDRQVSLDQKIWDNSFPKLVKNQVDRSGYVLWVEAFHPNNEGMPIRTSAKRSFHLLALRFLHALVCQFMKWLQLIACNIIVS
ncbi:hypothetical protein ACFX10_010758 [Malus domestica]